MHNSLSITPNLPSDPIVVLAEPIAPEPRHWLSKRVGLIESPVNHRERLFKDLAKAHALIVRSYTIVDQQLLNHAPNLRVVARAGAGLDNIDLDACKARNISVVYTPQANIQAVVEYVITMMLTALRPITRIQGPTDSIRWHALRQSAIAPRTCVGARLGIIGFGRIGSALGCVAQGLGMKVVYHDLRNIPEPDRCCCTPTSLTDLAKSSDVISIHVDGRESNRHLLGADFFNQLKEHVILLNTARGFVIHPPSARAFAQMHPQATLIFDVHDPEPIASDFPFHTTENVISTPHIAAGTQKAKEQMSWVVRDVLRVLEGHRPEFPATKHTI